VNRSSKAVKGKRRVETKARLKRRAVQERIRSEWRIDEATHGAGNYGTNGSPDNAGPQAGEAVALAANVAPKMNEQSLAALQAWVLLPLRNLQSWQEAWLRLLMPASRP
jgi:hypothetical protein